MFSYEEFLAEMRRKEEAREREIEARRERNRMKALAYDNMINHSQTKEQHDMYEMLWRSL